MSVVFCEGTNATHISIQLTGNTVSLPTIGYGLNTSRSITHEVLTTTEEVFVATTASTVSHAGGIAVGVAVAIGLIVIFILFFLPW